MTRKYTLADNEARYISFVIERTHNECWIWRGPVNGSGYGSISWRGKVLGAHQVAYLRTGKEIPYGKCILHKCDHPRCCNPAHLFLGTHSDNAKDAWKKGRNIFQLNPQIRPRGAKHANSKMTIFIANKIRKVYATGGRRQEDVGAMFGVCQRTISLIVRNQAWI